MDAKKRAKRKTLNTATIDMNTRKAVPRVLQKNKPPAAPGQAGYMAHIDDIKKLIAEWRKEGAFLDNEYDHREDRIVGQVFKECADQLEALLFGVKKEN